MELAVKEGISPKVWGKQFVANHTTKYGKAPSFEDLSDAYKAACKKIGKIGRFRLSTYQELTGQEPDTTSFDGALAAARTALNAVAEAHKKSKAGHKAATTKAKGRNYSDMSQSELVAEMGKIQRALSKLNSAADS